MPNRPSLIALDLDGTLLRTDKSVSPRTLAALDACRDAGIHLAIASARGAASIAMIVPSVLADGLWITHNGALAVRGGTVLHSDPITPETLRAVVELAHRFEPPALLFAEVDGRPCTSRDVEAMWGVGFTTVDFRTLGNHEVAKILVKWPDGMPHRALAEILPEGMEAILDRDGYAHVQRRGVSKHRALELCLGTLGIPWEKVWAFGDDVTDAGMLEAAGQGIAMGNAVAAVKALADRIAQANDQDGVAIVLEEMLAGS